MIHARLGPLVNGRDISHTFLARPGRSPASGIRSQALTMRPYAGHVRSGAFAQPRILLYIVSAILHTGSAQQKRDRSHLLSWRAQRGAWDRLWRSKIHPSL